MKKNKRKKIEEMPIFRAAICNLTSNSDWEQTEYKITYKSYLTQTILITQIFTEHLTTMPCGERPKKTTGQSPDESTTQQAPIQAPQGDLGQI